MIDKILSALKELDIRTYSITETRSWSAEAFFIRSSMDLKRRTTLKDYMVSVYVESEENGQKFVGDSVVPVYPGTDDAELKETLRSAYHAASFVRNPYYPLFDSGKKDPAPSGSAFAGRTLEENIRFMAETLFSCDTEGDVFVNSAEFFAVKKITRVVNSAGTDVSWETFNVNGEYVSQCLTPEDVETHHTFNFREPDAETFRADVEHAMKQTRDRACAKEAAPAGRYTVLLSGDQVRTIMSYYVDRADAGMIYQHYSDYEVGKNVQMAEQGDALTVILKAAEPYDRQGIPLTDRTLMENGVIKTIHGSARMAYYLGIEPTGVYRWLQVPTGSVPFAEMKKHPYLHIVLFSDFQMDSMTGHFGGEIRLAYLYDGEQVKLVTGGSMNGNILDAQRHMVFSTDRYQSALYDGPFAAAIPDVPVAGI